MLYRKSASQAGSYASPWSGFGGASTVYPSACRRWMTPSQLALLAHAPCTSTMVGLGPPPAPAGAPVWADAIWLSGMTRPAMATITAAIMSRSLPGGAIRVMFTEVSFPGVPSGVAHGLSLERGGGYPQAYCTCVGKRPKEESGFRRCRGLSLACRRGRSRRVAGGG